jgi:hypothetical protein
MAKRTKQEQEEYLRMLRERPPEAIAKVRAMMSIPRTSTEKFQKQKPTEQNK